MNETQYCQDFCGWTQEHAWTTRERQRSTADIADPVEKIEMMGGNEPREPVSLLRTLRAYLLKSQFQLAKRGRHFRIMMEDKRVNARSRLARNPRLRPPPVHRLTHAHRSAVVDPGKKTGLSLKTFRSPSPRSFHQLMSYDLRSTDA